MTPTSLTSQTHPSSRTCLVPQECQTGKAEASPLDSPPECWTYVSTFCFSPEEPGGWGFSQSCHTELRVGAGMGLQQVSAMSLLTSFDVGTELLTSS